MFWWLLSSNQQYQTVALETWLELRPCSDIRHADTPFYTSEATLCSFLHSVHEHALTGLGYMYRLAGEGANRRHPAEQAGHGSYHDDCDHPREVGCHHPQGGGCRGGSRREAAHHRRGAPAERRARLRDRDPDRSHAPPGELREAAAFAPPAWELLAVGLSKACIRMACLSCVMHG